MHVRKTDWTHLNVSLPPHVVEALDRRVAADQKRSPDLIITRLDLIREAIKRYLGVDAR